MNDRRMDNRRRVSARRRVRTGSALFLCAFSMAGMLLLRLISAWVGALAPLRAAGTLLFFGAPAFLGLFVVDGDQSHLLPGRALSGAQALWLGAAGALAVCPMTLLADVIEALAGRFGAPAAATAAGTVDILPMLLQSMLLAPVCEELFFRGYLLGALAPYGAARSAAATALVFALSHGLSWSLLCYALLGLLLAALTLRTGSLLAPLLTHMAYNAALLLVAGSGLSGLLSGLSPASGLARLIGCGAFAFALRRAFAARGVRSAEGAALRLGRRDVLWLLGALLAVAAAQVLVGVMA